MTTGTRTRQSHSPPPRDLPLARPFHRSTQPPTLANLGEMTSSTSCFVEVENPPTEEGAPPEWIDCYVVVNVDPKRCGPLARDLNAVLPLRGLADATRPDDPPPVAARSFPRTDHLKRIRRRPTAPDEVSSKSKAREKSTDNCGKDENDGKKSYGDSKKASALQHPSKRAKKREERKHQKYASWSLDMLVGSVAAVDYLIEARSPNSTQSLASILEKYNISSQNKNFARRCLPGRPARTTDELDQWNRSTWPTLFFREKTFQYKEKKMALTREDIIMMVRGMNDALEDAYVGQRQWKEWAKNADADAPNEESRGMSSPISGVVVANPLNGSVVSRASKERRMQGMADNNAGDAKSELTDVGNWSSFPDDANPLCTSALLAIQGVSRKEREAALARGMESNEFRSGQYLCTGYDVYLTKEPNVYEAMALVHSRVRRVVFGISDSGMGGLSGASANATNSGNIGIHSLPGTNHRYRAFKLDVGNDTSCRDEGILSLVRLLQELHQDLV